MSGVWFFFPTLNSHHGHNEKTRYKVSFSLPETDTTGKIFGRCEFSLQCLAPFLGDILLEKNLYSLILILRLNELSQMSNGDKHSWTQKELEWN